MRTSLILKQIMGTSERFASYVLSGQRNPSPQKARLIADKLGIPLEQVLFPDRRKNLSLGELIETTLINFSSTSFCEGSFQSSSKEKREQNL